MAQRILVHSHIAALEAEAASERLARTARATGPKPSIRAALGRGLIAIGSAIAPVTVDEPGPDAGVARGV